MPIDLGAVTETLFESELFGYVKGAFTDAKTDKPGKFELAEGGTLFLDEIGNLSYALQAKLLTALQRRTIVRVGGSKPIPIDVRVVCATPRTATWRRWCDKELSAKTCSTASTPSNSTCHLYVSARATS